MKADGLPVRTFQRRGQRTLPAACRLQQRYSALTAGTRRVVVPCATTNKATCHVFIDALLQPDRNSHGDGRGVRPPRRLASLAHHRHITEKSKIFPSRESNLTQQGSLRQCSQGLPGRKRAISNTVTPGLGTARTTLPQSYGSPTGTRSGLSGLVPRRKSQLSPGPSRCRQTRSS